MLGCCSRLRNGSPTHTKLCDTPRINDWAMTQLGTSQCGTQRCLQAVTPCQHEWGFRVLDHLPAPAGSGPVPRSPTRVRPETLGVHTQAYWPPHPPPRISPPRITAAPRCVQLIRSRPTTPRHHQLQTLQAATNLAPHTGKDLQLDALVQSTLLRCCAHVGFAESDHG